MSYEPMVVPIGIDTKPLRLRMAWSNGFVVGMITIALSWIAGTMIDNHIGRTARARARWLEDAVTAHGLEVVSPLGEPFSWELRPIQ